MANNTTFNIDPEIEGGKGQTLRKLFFIFGVIIILIILAFAVIKITPKLVKGFGSFGSAITSQFSGDEINVKTSKENVESEDKFTLSWTYSPNAEGLYVLSYSCIDNISVKIVSGKSPKSMICDTNYKLGETEDVDLEIALNKNNSYVDVPFKIGYIINATKELASQGEVAVTVTNGTPEGDLSASADIKAEPIEKKTSNKTAANTNTALQNTGKPDLAVVEGGAINNRTVILSVRNLGGNLSKSWKFSYITNGGKTETSPSQMALPSGAGMQYTLRFDENISYVKITLDSTKSISESNESNNIVTVYTGRNSSNNSDNSNNNDDDPDLIIENLEVGYLRNGRFVEDDNIDENETVVVRFTVKNRGGDFNDSWRYTVESPTEDNDVYKSSNQSGLDSGESKNITVKFNNPDRDDYTLEIEIDSEDDVDESNERNNTDEIDVEIN
jgi:hypothetical protein